MKKSLIALAVMAVAGVAHAQSSVTLYGIADVVLPTLFVYGQLDGKVGLYRSGDEGRHWTRIDDDAHRYGEVRLVVGDPRVYGRVYLGTHGRGIVYGDPR